MIGPRAVDDLVEALEADDDRIRARVMPLLALIQDPRGRGPLIAMLLDRSGRLREIAARCLGRFPSPETVAALGRALDRDRSERVRIAAVESLVDQYAAGQDVALCKVLAWLTDSTAPDGVRLATFSLLPKLRPSARRSLLARLDRDPSEAVRRAALDAEDRIAADAASRGGVDEAVAALASRDYATWNEAVSRLAACGTPAVRPLVEEMVGRAHSPEYCKRAGMALRAMGPRRARAVADLLDDTDEPLPLQVLVEVVGALGDKSQIYRLKDLIDRLRRRPASRTDPNGWDPLARVRAKAHLELARIGSRVAIDDLRESLDDDGHRLELESVAAVERIGKRDELALLLRAYAREDAFLRRRIAAAVRSIRSRERIRRDNGLFRALGRSELRALDEILPRGGRRRAVRGGDPA